ncbi:hypothetical protein HD806DRAFT_546240 [Xylariaceae sp. AK1471]|nr:hypothetical protein HD806DRAFT_546240 [Xylariaceae sp. AK1471]
MFENTIGDKYPFNYLVDHDVIWGCGGESYITYNGCGYAAYILKQGLEYLLKLAKTEDYAGRRKLLTTDKQYDIPLAYGPDLQDLLESYGSPPKRPESLGTYGGRSKCFEALGWLSLCE